MSVGEDLSRLLEGELSADEAAAVRARIASEGEVARAWATLQELPGTFEVLLRAPPPPGLDDAVLARVARRRSRAWPWALGAVGALAAAAAAALWLGWPRHPAEIAISSGRVHLTGEARVLAGEVRVEIDGEVEVEVEPQAGSGRVMSSGGGPMTKRTLAAVVTVAALTGTAVVYAGDAEPVVVRAGETTRIGPAPAAPAAPPSAPSDDARIRELEAQNALLRRLLEDADLDAHGTPIPWPPGLPEAFTPAGFERQVRHAVAECAPDVQILGFECSEPPCFALLRVPSARKDDPYGTWWDDLVNRCEWWTEPYTDAASGGSGEVTCPDGHTERFNAWGPSMDLVVPRASRTEAERENAGKRFTSRMEEIRRTWPCAD